MMAILPFPASVVRVILPAPLRLIALEVVIELPEISETKAVVPVIVPYVILPVALISNLLLPRVIVCPDVSMVPPFDRNNW